MGWTTSEVRAERRNWLTCRTDKVKLVSKKSNHFGAIAAFFLDWGPRTLTGGTHFLYDPPDSVPIAESRKDAAIAPK